MKLVSLDLETARIQEGLLGPPIVCGSIAVAIVEGQWPGEARVLPGWRESGRLFDEAGIIEAFEEYAADPEVIFVGANIAFDFGVIAAYYPHLIPLIFEMYEKRRIYDILIAQALDAIYDGTIYEMPTWRGGPGPLKDHKGKHTNRYSLSVVTWLNFSRWDAKENDFWRERYWILKFVPMAEWPFEARQYPVDDVVNALENALAQLGILPSFAPHEWRDLRLDNGITIVDCRHCGIVYREVTGKDDPDCTFRARLFHNLGEGLTDVTDQSYTAFCLHLGAMWGLRTDPERVAKLKEFVDAEHEKIVERFSKIGWIRDSSSCVACSGTRQTIKTGTKLGKCPGCGGRKKEIAGCGTCFGTGKVDVPTSRVVKCKTCDYEDGTKDGPALKRAVAIAYGASGTCATCNGSGKVLNAKGTNLIQCKGCDATGLDLSTSSVLPRAEKKGGVSTNRDTLIESGDEHLMAFGESETEKIRDTYVPFLEEGTRRPIVLRPNVLVASDRTSYEGLIQLMPRGYGVRACFRARPGYYYTSNDYGAIELCTLAQACLWTVGESRMAEIINESGDPGSLHTFMAAKMVGLSPEDLTHRIKVLKDKRAAGYRQAAKCFHPDTEVLTKRGWVKVGDVTLEDEVAAASTHDEGLTIHWQNPTALQKIPYSGKLVHLHNEGMDLRVTPDHRMLVKKSLNNKWNVVTPYDVAKAREWHNAGACWEGGWEPDERLLRLAVATQADGSYNNQKVRFGFTKQRKIDRLRSLLREGEYVEGISSQGAITFNLTNDLSQRVRSLLDEDKQFTWRWLELTIELRAVVLQEAAEWDSNVRPNARSYGYATTRRQNADVLQAIAAITGCKTRLTWTKDGRHGRENHAALAELAVRDKPNSRGGNLEVTEIPHTGEVHCISVPSSFIVVRDGGVPVVVGQCLNFGIPGGMGSAKLVLAKRARSEGKTEAPDGTIYPGIRFCILVGGYEKCGLEKVTEWNGRETPPICKACVEIADQQLKPLYFQVYPEMRRYFRWVKQQVEAEGRIPCLWSDRVRGGVDFTNGANHSFQGLAAHGMKRALRRLTREAYTDRKSILWGTRFAMIVHDESFAETPIDVAHESAPYIAKVMVDEMRAVVPDVTVAVVPALCEYWMKDMEAVYDASGKLIPWTPKN